MMVCLQWSFCSSTLAISTPSNHYFLRSYRFVSTFQADWLQTRRSQGRTRLYRSTKGLVFNSSCMLALLFWILPTSVLNLPPCASVSQQHARAARARAWCEGASVPPSPQRTPQWRRHFTQPSTKDSLPEGPIKQSYADDKYVNDFRASLSKNLLR